ncbi:hypothetical protein [Phenylobacterium sp.]|uniref:hypothetical protein n=1 Tax=Phenylobacterium sp. TaxID=1871053 RepID=UPI002C6F72BC|nr:hypothetical protein [Phenylobacterium sp.]HLZ76006.1 hypothetical protein [Phenylobacterium sp.]
MAERKGFDTATRSAIWHGHNKRCTYTGEPVEYSELEIDHIIPVKGSDELISRLKEKKIIPNEFDINGFENLAPTKSIRNGQKSNKIFEESAIVYYLQIAGEKKDKIEKIFLDSTERDRALTGFLSIKLQAEKYDLSIDDMVDLMKFQVQGDVPIRISPELGTDIYSANSSIATSLVSKPFALGGGSVTEIELTGPNQTKMACRNVAEFREAKGNGFFGDSQRDMNFFALADRTSEILRAIEDAKWPKHSAVRFPRITMKNLDRWSSSWLNYVPSPHNEKVIEDSLRSDPTLAAAVASGWASIRSQDDWSADFDWKFGFPVKLFELLRGDLDHDGEEEILVSSVAYADGGTFRASKITLAKVDSHGIIYPGEDR